MRLHMLLQILWSLEGLSTALAGMWFEWNVNSNVRGDVIPTRLVLYFRTQELNYLPFYSRDLAIAPGASQV